jgi:hypothetical protein
VLVRFDAEAPPASTVTRVVAEHDPGFGAHPWIRGSAPPLSWDEGWPMHAVAPGRWRYVSTELRGEVQLEVLVNDETWPGPNETIHAGERRTVIPSF